jgi:preprotein translocase subunit SecE
MTLGAKAQSMAEELGISKNPWQHVRDYFSDVRAEMRRVTWPGKQEIYGTTLMVILTTFLFGFYFWITDHAFSLLVGRILKHFLGR